MCKELAQLLLRGKNCTYLKEEIEQQGVRGTAVVLVDLICDPKTVQSSEFKSH